jgi:hypothetical protein
MLKIIPPKFVSTGEIYCGASSGYKPAKIITAQRKNPSIAVTSNSDVSSWNTNADIVIDNSTGKAYCADKAKETYTQIVVENPRPIEATCMLDEAGCITTDSSKAKSILYQEVKDGRIITRQEPVSDTDREIAKLWNLVKEIEKDAQERELMWQKINKELDRADRLLEEDKKTSYWTYTLDGNCHTWEI